MSNTVGATASFTNRHFTATVTNNAKMTLTSVVSGTFSQSTEGSTLQCLDSTKAVVDDAKITIPGKFLLKTVSLPKLQANVCIVFVYR